MGYIGNTPAEKFQTLDKQSFSVSATTGYTLSNAVTSPQEIALFINNVRQNPNSSYSVSGTSLTLSAATASGDTMYCVFLGKSVGTVAPALSSVTRKMLASPWQAIQTSAFTAVAGYAYMCNTTSSAFTVTLPGSATVGDSIQLVDYAGTFATNNLTLTSSAKIEGGTVNKVVAKNREGVTITFVDTTQGWVATSGVNEDTQALESAPYTTSFLVVAGGGGSQANLGSATYATIGGGAGGYRNSFASETSGRNSSTESVLTLKPTSQYTITVGAGGPAAASGKGANSVISGTGITTITSEGGGGGNGSTAQPDGKDGGSGAGAGDPAADTTQAGSGTAGQGFDGGDHPGGVGTAGGGGGASAAGNGAQGGNGLASSITGSSVTRGGGGSGGQTSTITGGTGGGGTGAASQGATTAGTANTGGGGGGTRGGNGAQAGKAGGSGVVILRMATSNYTGTTSGSPTVSQSGTDTILVYNASGSYTA